MLLACLVLVTGALAIISDVVRDSTGRPFIDPTTVATVGLVVVTGIYAWFNHEMARAAQAQLAATRTQEVYRRRETQVLATRPLVVDRPDVDVVSRIARVVIPVSAGYPTLHLTVVIRAMGEVAEAGSPDGKTSVSLGVGSWVGPRTFAGVPPQLPIAFLPIGQFLVPGGGLAAIDSPWEVQITYLAPLGQAVVERYEWWFNDITTKPLLGWQLKGIEITFTEISEAAPMVLAFGDD